VPPSCSYCDQLDMSLLRLTLLGEILRADDTVLVLLADVMQACGLRLGAQVAAATPMRPQPGTLHMLRRTGADNP
jgi:hypothetical protein